MNLIDFIYFNTDVESGGNFGERISYGKLWDRCIGVNQRWLNTSRIQTLQERLLFLFWFF